VSIGTTYLTRRYKGIISVKGFDEKFVFHGVHMLFDGNFMGEWGQDEKRISKFVFIGKNLDREELTKGFKDCIAYTIFFGLRESSRLIQYSIVLRRITRIALLRYFVYPVSLAPFSDVASWREHASTKKGNHCGSTWETWSRPR